LRVIAAARQQNRARMRSLRPARVRAPWRSRVRRSLQVQKIDSIRWADRREVRFGCAFVFAAGSEDRGVELGDLGGELAAGVALVAEQDFAAVTAAAVQQYQGDVAFVGLGGCELQCSWGAVGRDDRVQPKSPEVAGMRRAPAVVGGVAQRGAFDGLAAAGALLRSGVDERQIVIEPGALTRENRHQPLQCVRQAATTFEVPRLLGQHGEQMRQPLAGDREKPTVRRDPHDRLSDTQRDDLRVCDSSRSVVVPFGQEIVGRDEHGREQQVEVGVHRGLQGRRCGLSTADFDPAALYSSKPLTNTATAVESLI
jgi:hypothetical protein